MLQWLKNLYVVKLLWGEPEQPQKTLIHPDLTNKEKKKPGRKPTGRPGIKTRKNVKK